ncbi:hypothetical protein, partial [Vibrio cyclitrophicus]|uniref:hypothetical protein n=1 Tax=Vibrio cyclitrophicus TaxID=47951 RepID=UPI001A7E19A0
LPKLIGVTQRILTSKLIFIALSKKIDEHVILKLLPFQQNGNELTVPNNFFLQEKVVKRIGHSVH